MAIRPLDMQVMVPKLQNVAQMKHAEMQKAGIDQSNISNTSQKEVSHNQQSVVQSHKDQEMDHNADAKEESKSKYMAYKKPDGKHKNEEKKPPEEASYHKIDIKV